MEYSMLLEAVYRKYISDYREKLENDESMLFTKELKETSEKLEKNFNEEQMKIIKQYNYFRYARQDYIDFLLDIKLLNCGVKIGMQLQQAFDEDDM